MKVLKKDLPNSVSVSFMVLMVVLVIFLGSYVYRQNQEIQLLEYKLQETHQIQEAAIQIMRREKLLNEFLEDVLEIENLSEEQIDKIEDLRYLEFEEAED